MAKIETWQLPNASLKSPCGSNCICHLSSCYILCFILIQRYFIISILCIVSLFLIFVMLVAHGTYIGSLRLEAHKPTQLPIDSTFHFGASTRYYIIRERPQTGARPIIEELEKTSEEAEGGLLGLPETETELDVSELHVYIFDSLI
jgi:hypothetical protein